jgi:hypothetical protein
MRGSLPGERRGGRQKGTPNKATARRELETRLTGETPLDFLLQVMRDGVLPLGVRIDVAKAAAPFVHPKRAAISHVVTEVPIDLSRLSDEVLETLDRLRRTLVTQQ